MKLLKSRNAAPVAAPPPPEVGPDPRPLREALAEAKQARADMVELRATADRWRAEYEELSVSCNLVDESEVQLLSGMKIKADMAPNYVAKADRSLGDVMQALTLRSAEFTSELQKLQGAESKARFDMIEALLRPHNFGCYYVLVHGRQRFSKAATLAGQCDAVSGFAPVATTEPQLMLRSTSRDVETFDNATMRRAEQLLATYDLWVASGHRFLPEDLSKIEPQPPR